MGVAELREAFNSVSEPAGVSCAKAFLSYEHLDMVQFQRLTFHGTKANGEQFEARSDLISGGDLATAARDTASLFLATRPAEPAHEDRPS